MRQNFADHEAYQFLREQNEVNWESARKLVGEGMLSLAKIRASLSVFELREGKKHTTEGIKVLKAAGKHEVHAAVIEALPQDTMIIPDLWAGTTKIVFSDNSLNAKVRLDYIRDAFADSDLPREYLLSILELSDNPGWNTSVSFGHGPNCLSVRGKSRRMTELKQLAPVPRLKSREGYHYTFLMNIAAHIVPQLDHISKGIQASVTEIQKSKAAVNPTPAPDPIKTMFPEHKVRPNTSANVFKSTDRFSSRK